ncbi:MAG: class II fructose-bisphosphate aldolase [Candidatus Vogelbacteria bacterium]|nr:class II fructose-bisphosphate aldolase [Candidatus Vogelbacteria bacterium]
MKTLRECIAEAADKRVALGHFNVSTIEGIWAIARAARELELPVIIGVSEGERDFIGVRQAAALIRSVREELAHPIFLNADHTYSFDRVKETIDVGPSADEAGFDAVIFDGSKLPLAENIAETKRSVDYARSANREIMIEGELGYIGTSSKLLDVVPEGVRLGADDLVNPDDTRRFVSETGVDLFAPAVGNIHGMLKGRPDPALDIDRIKLLREAAGVPLVLHGASGNTDDDLRRAIAAGVVIIHINTELRVAYRDGLRQTLQENPEEVAPYKILKSAALAMQKVVETKLRLFNNLI